MDHAPVAGKLTLSIYKLSARGLVHVGGRAQAGFGWNSVHGVQPAAAGLVATAMGGVGTSASTWVNGLILTRHPIGPSTWPLR
jgi:hypothetical protein